VTSSRHGREASASWIASSAWMIFARDMGHSFWFVGCRLPRGFAITSSGQRHAQPSACAISIAVAGVQARPLIASITVGRLSPVSRMIRSWVPLGDWRISSRSAMPIW
jgi:hypothetical protein